MAVPMKELRRQVRMTAQEIADEIGVSLAMYYAYESGRSDLHPTSDVAMKFGKIHLWDEETTKAYFWERIAENEERRGVERRKISGRQKPRIREYRLKMRISQAELADRVGLSRKLIASYEHGSVRGTLTGWYDIAQFFNTTIEDIAGLV